MRYIFLLDEVEIDEPIGFAELKTSIIRDPRTHGVTFEASLSPLRFDGPAAAYITNQKNLNGIKANIVFEVLEACAGYDYLSVYKGRLNMGGYRERCGEACTVTVPVDELSCLTVLKARADQRVDLDKTSAADGFTVLAPYAMLGVEMELLARQIKAGIDGRVADDGHVITVTDSATLTAHNIAFRPLYAVKTNDSIATGNVDFGTDYGSNPGTLEIPAVVSPQLLFEDNITCFSGNFDYSFRMKGSINLNVITGGGAGAVTLTLFKGEWPSAVTMIDSVTLPTTDVQSFDETFSGTTTLNEGEGFYCLLEIEHGLLSSIEFQITFDRETSVVIEALKICPPTNVESYMIHEALSRVVESITNNCMRVRSEYYGRIDSAPFAFAEDGDGGLRLLTSGLKIRRAPEAKFFASLKELFDGLTAIDNIGMGAEADPAIPGNFLLRVEAMEYFYQSVEVMRCGAVPRAETEVIEAEHYSRLEVGYEKWEVEGVNGLDEINSRREYSTAIDVVSNTLSAISKLVTGSYAIETTRQGSFADTGAADTKYDNETFLITTFRGGYLYSEIFVEKGNILSPVNIFSPDTLFNYRLSPARNAMRWFKTVAAAFPNISGTDARLLFQSGTGNLAAAGEQASAHAKIENSVLGESDNISASDFAVQPAPVTKPERVTFEYPMSSAEYETVRANPYGYVSYQCGATGPWLKGWILSIEYARVKGVATLTLKKQWQS